MKTNPMKFSFVIMTDLHLNCFQNSPRDFLNIVADINALRPKPDFVFCFGDFSREGNMSDVRGYHAATRKLNMPVHHSLGNHDFPAYEQNKMAFLKLFGRLRKTVRRGNVKFFLIPGFDYPKSAEWLDRQLRKCPSNLRKVIGLHHPPPPPILSLAARHGVELVLFGHRHVNRYSRKKGVACLGTGTTILGGKVGGPSGFRIMRFHEEGYETEFRFSEVKDYTNLVRNAIVHGRHEVLLKTYDNGDPAQRVVIRAGDATHDLEQKTLMSWAGSLEPPTRGPGTIEIARVSGRGDSVRIPRPDRLMDSDLSGKGRWSAHGPFRGQKHPIIERKPDILWTAFPGGSCNVQGMVLDQGALYYTAGDEEMGRESNIARIDARNGEIHWRRSLSSKIRGSCCVGPDLVYAHAVMGTLHALRRDDGKQAWSSRYAGKIDGWFYGTPAYHDGVVYGGNNADFRAFDAESGRTLWRFTRGRKDWMFTSGASLIVGKYVVCPMGRGGLACLNRRDGSVHWHLGAEKEFGCACAPASTDGRHVYYTTDRWYVTKVEIRTGKVLWRIRLKNTSTMAAPTPYNGDVIIGDLWGRLSRLDGKTGRFLWTRRLPRTIINTTCYSRGHGCVLANPVVLDGTILVGSADGGLYGFDFERGKRLWRLELGAPVNSTPAIGVDAVYCATFDGTVHALRFPNAN